jgi:NAD(P)-dependent dehydrogenase (short-subunit alcohol dehydrogenase family)
VGLARKLEDSVAVITGAASGIGLATAYDLANRGAALVLAGHQAEALEAVAVECHERGAQALAVRTDVTDEEQVAALARRAVETFGRIDLWINNPAVTAFGSIEADHRGAGGSYPIAMPMLATPQWIVVIVAIMAGAVTFYDVTKVIVLLLISTAIDLAVLLAADRIIRWIDLSTLQIIARGCRDSAPGLGGSAGHLGTA